MPFSEADITHADQMAKQFLGTLEQSNDQVAPAIAGLAWTVRSAALTLAAVLEAPRP